MTPDKSEKENLIQQLSYLSKRYGEFLKFLDENENPIPKQTTQKRSWAAFLKKGDKKRVNTTNK